MDNGLHLILEAIIRPHSSEQHLLEFLIFSQPKARREKNSRILFICENETNILHSESILNFLVFLSLVEIFIREKHPIECRREICRSIIFFRDKADIRENYFEIIFKCSLFAGTPTVFIRFVGGKGKH